MTKPIIPEMNNQNHIELEASKGSIIPRENKLKTDIKSNAITSRIRFTDMEPTLFPADSNATAVIVQHNAAAREAISPKCDWNIFLPLF